MKSRDEILEGLNPAQKEVVTKIDGKYAVIAAPGSGKTFSMIARAEYLLASGVKPWEILMITFTKKAAGEISDRLLNGIGEDAIEVNTGTFHSIALRILLANQSLLGYKNDITVIDEAETASLISDIAASHGYPSKEGGREVARFIEGWQTEGLSPREVSETNEYPEDIVVIYNQYQKTKRDIGYVDFNDILNLSVYLLENYPHVREKYAKQYKYVIVDESQDSSESNLRMVELLSGHHKNFMLVMDDEQSIYGFRGANLKAVLTMLEKYSDLEVLKLERNYRSTQTIVEAANEVIKGNKNQLQKTSYSENKKGAPIFMYDATDEAREAEFVSTTIKALVSEGKYTYDDFMILYRSHWKGQAMEAGLNSAGIPYDIIGGTEFYERKDIKNLVCYLRAFDNQDDSLAMERIINTPKRGIGARTLDRIQVFANQANISFFEVLQNIEDVPKINNPTKKRIGKFVDFILEGNRMINESGAKASDALYFLLDGIDYLKQFNKEKTADIERIQLIKQLYEMANEFDAREKPELEEGQTIIGQFLTETALYIEEDEEDVQARVQMLTAHASKGLEAKIVFIIGMEHGVFPSSRSETEEQREEERRLFYVAMTRAEELLFLTYSEKSYMYGRTRENTPSLFLSEVPDKYTHWLGQKHRDVPF